MLLGVTHGGADEEAWRDIHRPGGRGNSAPAGAGGNSNFGVHFNLGAGKPLNVHVNHPIGGPGASDVRKLIGKGFRNFFEEPTNEKVFRYRGKPIDHTPDLQKRLGTATKKLAFALEGPRADTKPPAHSEVDKAGREKNVDPRDNPNIPSGYTYLMQLVAHDIVQSTSSLARTDDGRIALNNIRTAMLRLEAVYDGGPEASPLLQRSGPGGRRRVEVLPSARPPQYREGFLLPIS